MGKRRIGLHEVVYERLSEAEQHAPHPPVEMRSGQSSGPVKMWVCHEIRCHEVTYTYGASLEAPICRGGAMWSFTTDGTYRRGVHKEWVNDGF